MWTPRRLHEFPHGYSAGFQGTVPRTTIKTHLPLQLGDRGFDHSFFQNNSQLGLFHHQHANLLDPLNPEIKYYNLLIVKVRFPGFLIHEGIICHPWYTRHILERLQLPQCRIVFLPPDRFN